MSSNDSAMPAPRSRVSDEISRANVEPDERLSFTLDTSYRPINGRLTLLIKIFVFETALRRRGQRHDGSATAAPRLVKRICRNDSGVTISANLARVADVIHILLLSRSVF